MRVSMVQATGFLPLLLPLTITVHSAQLGSHSKRVALPFGQLGPFASRTIEKRVDEDGCPEAFDDDENTEFDAVTLDQEAGLGMEFETGAIHIDVDGDCDEDTSQV